MLNEYNEGFERGRALGYQAAMDVCTKKKDEWIDEGYDIGHDEAAEEYKVKIDQMERAHDAELTQLEQEKNDAEEEAVDQTREECEKEFASKCEDCEEAHDESTEQARQVIIDECVWPLIDIIKETDPSIIARLLFEKDVDPVLKELLKLAI